jgi:hypothetical protein
MIVVGILCGVIVVGWLVRHRPGRRRHPQSQGRWAPLVAMGALTRPFLHDRRSRPARRSALHGDARLVFVQVHGDSIVIDGLIAATTETLPQPFWLQVRRPGAPWMSTTLESLMEKWAAEGSVVTVETRPSRQGCQATLAQGRSRMVFEVEAVGGLADAA